MIRIGVHLFTVLFENEERSICFVFVSPFDILRAKFS